MGTQLVKISLGGEEFFMEAEEGVEPAQGVAGTAALGAYQATDMGDTISKAIRGARSSISEALVETAGALKPDRVTAAFGVKVSGEGNVFFAKCGGEASLTLTLEWEIAE